MQIEWESIPLAGEDGILHTNSKCVCVCVCVCAEAALFESREAAVGAKRR